MPTIANLIYPVGNAPAAGVFNGSWTSPNNAHADNATYATCAPAKNQEFADVWNFQVGTDVVPAGATAINVTVEFEYFVSTTASVAEIRSSAFADQAQATAISAVPGATDALEPTAVKKVSYSFGITEAQLRNFWVRVQALRGNNNNAVTFSLDYVRIISITYTDPPNAKIDTLKDDFNDNVRDAAKWEIFLVGTLASAAEVNQRVEVTPPSGAGDRHEAYFRAINKYDLTGSAVHVEVPQILSGGSVGTEFRLYLDNGDLYRFTVQGSLFGQYIAGGTFNTFLNIAYDPVAHRWWRFRHDSAVNLLHFETSPDGGTWTSQANMTPAAGTISSLRPAIGVESFGVNSAPGVAFFDRFNIAPATPKTVVVTGQETPSAIGSVVVRIDKTIAVTGQESPSAIGTVAVLRDKIVPVTGQESPSAVGAVAVASSGAITVALVGQEAPGAIGAVGIINDKFVAVAGQESPSAIGSVTLRIDRTRTISGLESPSAVGAVSVVRDKIQAIPGLEAPGVIGNIAVGGNVIIPITGLEAPSAVGNAFVQTPKTVAISGLQATSAAGTVAAVPTKLVTISGIQASGVLGNVSATGLKVGEYLLVTDSAGLNALRAKQINANTYEFTTDQNVANALKIIDQGNGTYTLSSDPAAKQSLKIQGDGSVQVKLAGLQATAATGGIAVNWGRIVSVNGLQAEALLGAVSGGNVRIVELVGLQAAALLGVVYGFKSSGTVVPVKDIALEDVLIIPTGQAGLYTLSAKPDAQPVLQLRTIFGGHLQIEQV